MPYESETSARRAEAREREQRAFELRKAGAGYAQIGQALGVSKQAAHGMVRRVLKRLAKLTEGDAETVRRLEVERLDALLLGLWDKARRGNEGATDRVLKIMQRRSELLGLDAPKRAEVTTNEAKVVRYEFPNDNRGPGEPGSPPAT